MKNYFKKVVGLVLLVVVALCSFFVTGCNGKKDEEYIVIGMSGPLTGGASVYGIAVQHSAEMAIEEINAKGGLNGYKLKLVATDDQHDASKVSTNFATLLEKGMQVSLGCVTTKPGLEFKNLSKEENVFFLTPSATGDAIPEFANGYQMCFADTRQGTFSAKYVNENLPKDTKVGVLYLSGDDYSEGIYNNFKANLDKDFTLVEASFNEGDKVTDLSSQVELLKDCDFIFLPIYYTPASVLMTQGVGKIKNSAVYFGCDGLDGIDTAIEGFDINTIPQEVSYLSHFNSNATEGAAKEYIDKYKAKYGAETLNQFGASAYDCVYAIYNALCAANTDANPITPETSASEICEALKAVFQGGFTFSGVTGTNVKWDANGFVDKAAVKYVVKEKTNK